MYSQDILPGLFVVLDINNGRLEFACGNPPIEQNVGLAVRAMLELGKEEVSRDPADDCSTTPDIAAFACNVPSRWIEQLRGEIDHRNLGNIVGGAADTCAQGAETDRGSLGNDRVRDRPESAGVDKGDDDAETCLGVLGLCGLLDRGADTEYHEHGDVKGRAVKIDGATAKPGGQEPRAGVGDELQTRVDQIELESEVGGDAGLWVCRVSCVLGGHEETTHARRRK